MRFLLLMTQVLRIWFMQIFARPEKTHEPRTKYVVKSANQPKIVSVKSALLEAAYIEALLSLLLYS